MTEPSSAPARQSPLLYVLLLALTVAAFAYLALRQKDDYLLLTVNRHWQIYLMGEGSLHDVKFHKGSFQRIKSRDRHLWLRGYGVIHWHHNRISVHKGGVYFNNRLFSQAYLNEVVSIVFSRNGQAHKGLPASKTPKAPAKPL